MLSGNYRRLVQAVSLVGMMSVHVAAQQSSPSQPSPGDDFQNWDELDIRTRVSPRLDVMWAMQVRLSSQLQNPAIYVFGADANVAVSQHIVVTPSYFYFTFRTVSGTERHAHSPIAAATLFSRYRGLTLSDRNRVIGVLGVADARDFWIYGNRPMVDFTVGPHDWKLSLFVWDEFFYFSNQAGWTRNRFAVGARKVLNERTTANWFYQRQDDRHSNPAHFNTVAAAIELRVK